MVEQPDLVLRVMIHGHFPFVCEETNYRFYPKFWDTSAPHDTRVAYIYNLSADESNIVDEYQTA